MHRRQPAALRCIPRNPAQPAAPRALFATRLRPGAQVLAHAAEREDADAPLDLERTQEALVLTYLSCVMRRSETIGEDKILSDLLELSLVPLVIRHLHAHGARLRAEDQLAGATFLADTFEAEDFHAHRNDFIPADCADLLKGFKPLFVGELTAEPGETRRKLRPLLDMIVRCGG